MNTKKQKTQALLAEVANKMQRGQDQQALDSCESILQSTPNCYEAYIYAGQILLKNDRVKQAIDAFKDALKYAPSHPTVWALLYQAYYRVNAAEHAERALKKAIQYQRPADAEAHKAIATTLAQQGRQQEAAKWYAIAVKSNPKHLQLLQNYAVHLTYLGKYQQAEAALKQILNSSHATNAELAAAHVSLSRLVKAPDAACLAPLQKLLTRLAGQD
ncbi:MAG: tetratricopeptide repeat protein, partial [Pseudomonadales bacterium]|nr:tetratricopeptide repeat protein [Pseudomonadales bacterium]